MKSARWLPLTVIALCLGSIALFAGMAGGDTNDYEAITATFFEQIKAGQYGQAVDGIYASNPWVQSKPDNIAQLKQQFLGLTQLVGEYSGHELVCREVTAGRFVYCHYVAFFDREPLSFEFQFYRPGETWRLHSFSYHEDFDEWVIEKAKRRFAADAG